MDRPSKSDSHIGIKKGYVGAESTIELLIECIIYLSQTQIACISTMWLIRY